MRKHSASDLQNEGKNPDQASSRIDLIGCAVVKSLRNWTRNPKSASEYWIYVAHQGMRDHEHLYSKRIEMPGRRFYQHGHNNALVDSYVEKNIRNTFALFELRS